MKWIKASERLPDLYPVNATSELHFRLDGRKVDGYFLHSRCFEYFNVEIAGYSTIEFEECGRVEWLDEGEHREQGEEGRPSNRIDLFSPAEKAIYDAAHEVEKIGADERLTKAVTLLAEVRQLVYEYLTNKQ